MVLLLLFLSSIVYINALKCNNIEYNNIAINLEKYSGLWYEYSHSSSFIFEKDCKCVTANYTINTNNIQVDNSCVKNNLRQHTIGTAIPDNKISGRLNVKFFKFSPTAPYDVIYIDDLYETAVVLSCYEGLTSFHNMWFLTRTPTPNLESINIAKKTISQFDFSNQILMEQSCSINSITPKLKVVT